MNTRNETAALSSGGERNARHRGIAQQDSTPKLGALPVAMRTTRRWVLWRSETRDGRSTKVPYQADNPERRASSTDPSTWASFNAAREAAPFADAGVGFVLGQGFLGVDLDGALDENGAPTPESAQLLRQLPDTYTEVSPSGRGLHLYYAGDLSGAAGVKRPGIEVYGAGRYFTVTGRRFGDAPRQLADGTEALGQLCAKLGGSGPRDREAPLCEGERNDGLFRAACAMRREGLGEQELLAALQQINIRRCRPPLGDGELVQVARSATRYPEDGAATPPASAAGGEREAVAVRLSDVEPEDVAFLWEPYLPAGKLAILEGDPGAGKTWIALAVAATVSSGGGFPGRVEVAPSSVLYVTFEDGIADTLRPRLDRLGADCSHIEALTGWRENGEDKGPITAAKVDLLRREVERLRPALVVIDPIQGYVGRGVDMHRANETRPVLAALARMAEDSGAVVVIVRHLRKSGSDRAVHRGLGSIDFAAAARSVLLVGEDPNNPDGNRVMAHVKSSLAPRGASLAFSLDGGAFGWTGESDLTAEALLAPRLGESERSELEEAVEYLADALADGPVAVKDLEGGAPCSKSTLKRAKKRLGVQARKADFKGGWEWFLPDSNPPKGTKHVLEPLRGSERPKSQSGEGDSRSGPTSPSETLGLLRETPVSRPPTEGSGESRETPTPGLPCPRCRSPFCPGCGDGEPAKEGEVEL